MTITIFLLCPFSGPCHELLPRSCTFATKSSSEGALDAAFLIGYRMFCMLTNQIMGGWKGPLDRCRDFDSFVHHLAFAIEYRKLKGKHRSWSVPS